MPFLTWINWKKHTTTTQFKIKWNNRWISLFSPAEWIWESHSDNKGTGFYYIGLTIRKESLDSNYVWINYTEPVCLLNGTERHFTCPPVSSCAFAYVISSTVSHSGPGCWPQCLDPEYKETCSEKLTRMALGWGINTSPDGTYGS